MLVKNQEYLRSILFGIEDSLTSTTGLVAGVSVGAENKKFVFLAVIVSILIEAVSMGAGEYLSDDTVKDLDKLKRNRDNPFLSGLLMLVSYLLAGVIPLIPSVFAPYPTSLILGIMFAFIGFFLLGYIKGKVLHTPAIRGGLKVLLVGGIATMLGMFVGFVLKL